MCAILFTTDPYLLSILDRVPRYREFLTVQELDNSSDLLAEQLGFSVFEAGKSQEGRSIKALEIGEGEETALFFAFPHPNEPIGSMTLEFLSWELARNRQLRERLGFKFLIVKVADPDGAKLNEGWFKGGFTPLKYAENYYRPPGREQVEWNFPIDYKTLHWRNPIPETKALMDLIGKYRPRFVYSLHNAGFCGVYFYLTHEWRAVYPMLQSLVLREGLPLHKGEPEVPYLTVLDDAIYKNFGIDEAYNYYEEHGEEDPASLIDSGTSSDAYLKEVCNGQTLVCELPYLYDERVSDSSPSGKSRRDCLLSGLDFAKRTFDFQLSEWETCRDGIDTTTRIGRALVDYFGKFGRRLRIRMEEVREGKAYEREATVGEAFDAMVERKFERMLTTGLLWRGLAEALKETGDEKIEKARKEVHDKLVEINSQFLAECSPTIISVRKLVRVQLGAAFIMLEHALPF